jgi:hypothetical protein
MIGRDSLLYVLAIIAVILIILYLLGIHVGVR